MTTLNPYLNFDGTAAAAMAFYQSVLGGELTSSSFGDFGMSSEPGQVDKVMHAQLVTSGGLVLMAADVPSGMRHEVGNNVSVSIAGDDVDELRGWFDGLSQDGTPGVPFEVAPWGDTFGMFTDQFGINWLVNAVAQQA